MAKNTQQHKDLAVSTNPVEISASKKRLPGKGRPSILEVDTLADELATEYDNCEFTQWYCRVIWKHGTEKVQTWRQRSAKGKHPARLFSAYVKAAEAKRYAAEHRRLY